MASAPDNINTTRRTTSQRQAPQRHSPLKPTELLIPLAIAIAITAIAQRWSGLDTPDSSFYATLALFGDEVTDRAPFTSYYWTRLGYIAPVDLLTSLLGAFPGFLALENQ